MRKADKKELQLFKFSTIKLLHKWLSLLVFIQLFIWLGSGLFFNLMDHSKASGNQYRQSIVQADIDEHRLLGIQDVLAQSKVAVKEVSFVQRLGQPHYLLTHEKGLYRHFKSHLSLVNAYTGEIELIDKEMASALALETYSGEGSISGIIKVKPPIDDFPKEQNTLWQVNFIDELNTRIYINASSGQLIGHSNDDKRFADFFFMLHFMDFASLIGNASQGFNNWLIIFFALLTLAFCFTGLIWTLELLVKGRYKIKLK
jgi:hypothetical protein